MNLRSLFSRTASTCLLLTLAACGGGGGDSSSASASFTIGGTVTGLAAGTQIVLSDNGNDALTVSANSAYTFAKTVSANGTYLVTITTQPTGQTCTVASGSGAGVVAAITNVAVTCSTNTPWSQQAYVKASNAYQYADFGHSVAISGDTLVVGADGEASNQTTITNGSTASADNSTQLAGAVYVFVRSGTDWSQQAYLKAANANGGDYFGGSVAISGDTIVVGAFGESSNQTTITNGSSASSDNSAASAGAAYVFVRNGASWSQQAYLKAPNAGESDYFGASVAINSDTIVAGAAFERSNQTTITNGSTASTDNSLSLAGAAYVVKRGN